jgi:hypothetical protein
MACDGSGEKYVVDSNGAWIRQWHKDRANCLDVPWSTKDMTTQLYEPAGECVASDYYGTSIKYTVEGAADAKTAADADTALKAEKAYDASIAAARAAAATTTTRSPTTGAPAAEDALGEGQKVDFQIIIALIFGIIVTIFNN